MIVVVEEVVIRVTNNDTKRKRSESSLILSGRCFANPLPKMVVFDNGGKMVCETLVKYYSFQILAPCLGSRCVSFTH